MCHNQEDGSPRSRQHGRGTTTGSDTELMESLRYGQGKKVLEMRNEEVVVRGRRDAAYNSRHERPSAPLFFLSFFFSDRALLQWPSTAKVAAFRFRVFPIGFHEPERGRGVLG
jgi:hypothetical protein